MDIVRGDLGPLATGLTTPDFLGDTDYWGILRYSLGKPEQNNKPELTTEERQALWRGLNSIPTEFEFPDSNLQLQKLPGYYEFALVRHGQQLVPLFVDAKPSSKDNQVFTTKD
jgi:hypothetical protein